MVEVSYLKQVLQAAENGKYNHSEVIYNRSADHASMLISTLANYSTSHLNIVCGCLDEATYGKEDVVVAIKSAVTRGVDVRVMMDGRCAENGVSAAEKYDFLENNLKSIGDLSDEEKQLWQRYPFHFLESDRSSFRFEPNWENTEAFANFCDPKIAIELNTWFVRRWPKKVNS